MPTVVDYLGAEVQIFVDENTIVLVGYELGEPIYEGDLVILDSEDNEIARGRRGVLVPLGTPIA